MSRDRKPPRIEGTVASGALCKLFLGLERLGIDAGEVRAEAGIAQEALASEGGRIHVADLHRAWAAADRRLGRPDLALFVAQLYTPGDYGLLGVVAMTATHLGEALASVARFAPLWVDEPRLVALDDGLELVWSDGPPVEPAARFAVEAAFAEVVHAARTLTNCAGVGPREVSFSHAGPSDVSAHARFFGCPVRFGARSDQMRFSPSILAAPFPAAAAQLAALLRDKAAEELGRHKTLATPHHRVKQLIGQELPRGLPPIDRIARRLATSERTLRRRLEAEGTSFRQLVDQTRREIAERHILDGRCSLAEIAGLVGFSEASALARAFKRWTGAPPAEWRARASA